MDVCYTPTAFEQLCFFSALLPSPSLESSPTNPTSRPRRWWWRISIVMPSLICLIWFQYGPQPRCLHALVATAAPKLVNTCSTWSAHEKRRLQIQSKKATECISMKLISMPNKLDSSEEKATEVDMYYISNRAAEALRRIWNITLCAANNTNPAMQGSDGSEAWGW